MLYSKDLDYEFDEFSLCNNFPPVASVCWLIKSGENKVAKRFCENKF